MNNKDLKINNTVRRYPRTLQEAFPSHEPYAIEHYKRKMSRWPWVFVAVMGWGYLCYQLM